jgi:UDPglucose--hexose-1-phosphate uridylyltransferase
MNEIRKDYLIDRWVILSPRRSKRPRDLPEEKQEYKIDCPFCPNNEYMTPPTLVEKPGKRWKVRVFENKYPALKESVKFNEDREVLKIKISGTGVHEVLVDSPVHGQHIGDFTLSQMKLWYETLKERVIVHRKNKNIKFVSIFKNHGSESGASLEHQHTQLIGVPLNPSLLNMEMKAAKKYMDFEGRCFFCDLARMESKSKRTVINNKYVVAFCSYAPLWPYEVWIIPKKHISSVEMPEITEKYVLKALKKILKAYYNILSDPPFNIFFHYVFDPKSRPKESEYYHFHIEIAPRIEKDGGFEYASGINITTKLPEDAAKELKAEIRKMG